MNNNQLILEIDGTELEKWKHLIAKMEQVFLDAGFNKKIVNNIQFLVYKHSYCKITPLAFPTGGVKFVLEWADNINEAKNMVLEDGDLYPTDIPEDRIINMLKTDLEKQMRFIH